MSKAIHKNSFWRYEECSQLVYLLMRNRFPKTMFRLVNSIRFPSWYFVLIDCLAAQLFSCCLSYSFLAIFKLQSFIDREVSHWHLKSNRIVSINHTIAIKSLSKLFPLHWSIFFFLFKPAQFPTFTLDLWVNWTRGVNSTLTIVLKNLCYFFYSAVFNRTRN